MLGFADSAAFKMESVLRTAPFIGLCYSVLVLWVVSSPEAIKLASPPRRPWYPQKAGLSFADILRAARRAAGLEPIRKSPMDFSNFRKPRSPRSSRQGRLKFAPENGET